MLEALDHAKKDPDTERTLWELSCRCVELERRGPLNPDLVEQHKLQVEIAELWPVRVWENVTPYAVSMKDKCTLTDRVQQRALAAEHRRLQATAARDSSTRSGTLAGVDLPKSPRDAAKTKKRLDFEMEVRLAMDEAWNRYKFNRAKDPTLKEPKKWEMHVTALELINDKGIKSAKKNPNISMVKDASAGWQKPRPPRSKPIPALAPKARPHFKGDK
jgi:hypothetical protein